MRFVWLLFAICSFLWLRGLALQASDIITIRNVSQGPETSVVYTLPDTIQLNVKTVTPVTMWFYGVEQLFGPIHTWFSNFELVWDSVSSTFLNASNSLDACSILPSSHSLLDEKVADAGGKVGSLAFYGKDLFYIDSSASKLLIKDITVSQEGLTISDHADLNLLDIKLIGCHPAASLCVVYKEKLTELCVINKNMNDGTAVISSCFSISQNPARLKMLSPTLVAVIYPGNAVLYSLSNSRFDPNPQILATDVKDVAYVANSKLVLCTLKGLYLRTPGQSVLPLGSDVQDPDECTLVEAYNQTVIAYKNAKPGNRFLAEFAYNETSLQKVRQYHLSGNASQDEIINSQLIVDANYVYLYSSYKDLIVVPHSYPQQLTRRVFVKTKQGEMISYLSLDSKPYSTESQGRLVLSWVDGSRHKFLFFSPFSVVSGVLSCKTAFISQLSNTRLSFEVIASGGKCPQKMANGTYNTVCKYNRKVVVSTASIADGTTNYLILYIMLIVPLVALIGCGIILVTTHKGNRMGGNTARQAVPLIAGSMIAEEDNRGVGAQTNITPSLNPS